MVPRESSHEWRAGRAEGGTHCVPSGPSGRPVRSQSCGHGAASPARGTTLNRPAPRKGPRFMVPQEIEVTIGGPSGRGRNNRCYGIAYPHRAESTLGFSNSFLEYAMRFPSASRWPVLVALAFLPSLPLAAEEFDQLVAVLKKTWPDRKEIAMVCDPNASQPFVDDLRKVAGAGLKVKVYEVRTPGDLGDGVNLITAAKAEVVVLVPSDPVAGDGLKEAEYLIKKLASSKIPTVATTESGVRQAPDPGSDLAPAGWSSANAKAAGVVGLPLPANGKSI